MPRLFDRVSSFNWEVIGPAIIGAILSLMAVVGTWHPRLFWVAMLSTLGLATLCAIVACGMMAYIVATKPSWHRRPRGEAWWGLTFTFACSLAFSVLFYAIASGRLHH